MMNTFEQGPIRPPAEAESLLIRTTRGCPWNRCHFCTLFKGMRFSIRGVDAIKKDIEAARSYYGNAPFETCFLQDGDSFAMRTQDLVTVLWALKKAFPSLTQISSYGRAQTMMRKSEAEMREISDAGLNMLYSGIESGSGTVLDLVNKGVTQDAIIESTLRAKNAGMSIMVFVILGLGGKEFSGEHVRETAHVLNTIRPNSVRIMSLALRQHTELWKRMESNSFTMLTESEMIREQRALLEALDTVNCHYGNFHGINLLTEIDGILPGDREQLLSIIDDFLNLSPEMQNNFILGRRLGYYRKLAGFERETAFSVVQLQLDKSAKEETADLESLFHELRSRIM